MEYHRPVSIHPENPRYFFFRGQPRALVCATEHYGSVINRRFDFERYLDDAADKRQTLTRLFLLFRGNQDPLLRIPYSSLMPDPQDYVAPWVRTGPGKTADGELRFDLDRWNDEYFERLRRFMTLASQRSIIVEASLFSNPYSDYLWALHPLCASSNINGVGDLRWYEYTTLREPALVERQQSFVRRVAHELNDFDNFYYEICNEPGGAAEHVTPTEVDAWQETIAATLYAEEAKLPHQHLVAGTNAFQDFLKRPIEHDLSMSFANPIFHVANYHPGVGSTYRGQVHAVGEFMSGELKAAELRGLCLATAAEPKPFVVDEDNSASIYVDDTGWTIHRKRAWTTVLSGGHYDYIDFSIVPGHEAGTEESRQKIRTWMRNLSAFIHAFDFVHARPDTSWLQADLPHVVVSGLAVPGSQYVAYIADGREREDPGAGTPLSGAVALTLPAGVYLVSLYSPVAGQESPGVAVEGGQSATLALPPFVHDVVVVVRRRAGASDH